MLFRCMMILFLLMISVMPVWAEEKDASSDLITEFRQKYQQRVNESPLSKLIVTTEDWREDNTYYVRHTIANPTNEKIKKKLTRIQVSYSIFDSNHTETLCNQYSDAISELIVPANNACTVTTALPLPIKSSDVRIEYSDTLWEFTDQSFLLSSFATEVSPFHLSLSVSPNGKPSVSIANNSDSQTITELKGLILEAHFTPNNEQVKKHLYFFDDKTYALAINPKETATISLPKNFSAEKTPFKLNSYVLRADINNIRHKNIKLFDLPIAKEDDTLCRVSQKANYHLPFMLMQTPLNGNGTFAIDNDSVHCYIHIKNTTDTPISLDRSPIIATLTYYDNNFLLQKKKLHIILPNDLTVHPNEEKGFSCSARLPSDFNLSYPIMDFTFSEFTNIPPYTLTQADSVPAFNTNISYTDLGIIPISSFTPKEESFYRAFPYPISWFILARLSPSLLYQVP